jgi:hypothetical protein
LRDAESFSAAASGTVAKADPQTPAPHRRRLSWRKRVVFSAVVTVGFFAVLTLLVFLVQSTGRLHGAITSEHHHDLGKLIFAFVVFWAYIAFSQYMLIWYANLPEETGFVFARLWGPWIPVARAVISGMFFIPFAVLLGVAPKKSRVILGTVAVISLSALFLERFLMVIPSVSEENGPVFGMPELAPTALFLGLFLATYALWARTYPMISPRLAEITLNRELHHHEVEVYDHEDTDKDFVHEADLEK